MGKVEVKDGGFRFPANDGGSAFPASIAVGPDDSLYEGAYGMTLRDWFAGQALAGIMVNAAPPAFDDTERDCDFSVKALAAYELADAMLVERSSKP